MAWSRLFALLSIRSALLSLSRDLRSFRENISHTYAVSFSPPVFTVVVAAAAPRERNACAPLLPPPLVLVLLLRILPRLFIDHFNGKCVFLTLCCARVRNTHRANQRQATRPSCAFQRSLSISLGHANTRTPTRETCRVAYKISIYEIT